MAAAAVPLVAPRLGGAPRAVLVAIGLYVAALIVAGVVLHPIKAVGVENDDYVAMAETILAGRLPVDPFRPLLYSLATAAVGLVVGNCFLAAKIVSSLAAGLLLATTFVLAARCVGRRAAVLATALVASNGWIVTHGMLASTDMLFTALSVAAVAAAVRVWDRPSGANLIALGAWLALAWFTRYQAVTLVLPALVACATPASPGSGGYARVQRAVIVAAAALVCLVPHFVLTYAVFGAIVHDENWRSVELKYFHGMVFSRLEQTTLGSVAAVIAHDPAHVASQAMHDLRRFAGQVLVGLVQGGERPAAGGYALAVLAAAGLGRELVRRSPVVWLGVGWLALTSVTLCVLFVPLPRLALANVPFAALGVASLLAWLARGRLAVPARVLAAVALGYVGWHAVAEVQRLRALHPWAEIAAVTRHRDATAVPFRLLTPYAYLATHLQPGCCVWVQPPYVGEDVAAYAEGLVREADARGAAYALFGRVTCGDVVFDRLATLQHPRLRVRERLEDTLLFEVAGVELDWVAHVRVDPWPPRGGALGVEVVLRDDVPAADVLAVGVVLRGPGGERHAAVQLQAAGGGVYRSSFDVPAPAAEPSTPSGAWIVEPIVTDTRGRFGGGPRVVVTRP